MAYLKTEAPIFREDEGTEARVERLAAYNQQLRRELEYVLTHLGSGNMNGKGLTLELTDDTGDSIGSLGNDGDSIGLFADDASVTLSRRLVTVRAGDTVLRIADGSARVTEDGTTWESLIPEEQDPAVEILETETAELTSFNQTATAESYTVSASDPAYDAIFTAVRRSTPPALLSIRRQLASGVTDLMLYELNVYNKTAAGGAYYDYYAASNDGTTGNRLFVDDEENNPNIRLTRAANSSA